MKGSYALTVEPESGSGPVYAARMLARPQGGLPAFTVQPLPDDRGSVLVPTMRPGSVGPHELTAAASADPRSRPHSWP